MSVNPVDDTSYWLDDALKTQPNVKELLVQWARSGRAMENFNLRCCDLAEVDLVNHGSKQGFNLHNADLYRANLQGAHLFNVDFSGSSLMKADLRGANLHCARLTGCNLLGTNFEGAKLDRVKWPEEIIQESQGKALQRQGQYSEADDFLGQAEETYRNIRIACEASGLFETAGRFFYKEMVMRRLRMPRFSLRRGISTIVDVFCGYGERPSRVVFFSLYFIVFCSLVYFLAGIHGSGQPIGLRQVDSAWSLLTNFFSCLYFSVVTFTTLGYGDLTPFGISRFMAAFEAFTGSFTMALFVVVFVKKMTR